MKRCPQCGTAYTDASLRFCLADGTPLETAGDSDPTVFGGRRQNVRVEIPEEIPTAVKPAPPSGSGRAGTVLKIAVAAALLSLLAVAVVGLAGAVYYFNSGRGGSNVAVKSPTPSPTASPTPTTDPERERLERELANLQKRLEEQNRTPTNTNPFPDDNDGQSHTETIATVDSPGDGFLALRNLPSVQYGERLAKIPHGAKVTVLRCSPAQIVIDGRYGRWCYVDYTGIKGFAFDAWLDY